MKSKKISIMTILGAETAPKPRLSRRGGPAEGFSERQRPSTRRRFGGTDPAMSKQYYYLKLIPPRPTFPFDMTDEEKRLMQEHARHLQEHFEAGKILIYGPVLATGAPFGMGVFEVDDEAQARRIMDDDPTVRASLNRYELSPMRVGAARGI
jgi:uncharacterized protein YciI